MGGLISQNNEHIDFEEIKKFVCEKAFEEKVFIKVITFKNKEYLMKVVDKKDAAKYAESLLRCIFY